jgi:ATP-dependent RNA helicase DDX51/DBP6
MASQIYARYIPPKKGTNKPANSIIPPPAVNPSLTPTSTLDASSTYARYIPPKRKLIEPEPVLVSKKQRTGDDGSGLEGNVRAEVPAGSSPKLKKKGKKASKKDSEEAKGDVELQDDQRNQESPKSGNIKSSELASQSVLEEGNGSPPRPKKIKKNSIKADASPEDDVEQTPRHAKVLEKREKSLRKAQRRAAKEAVEEQEAQERGDSDPEEVPEEPLYDLVPLPQPDAVPEPEFTPTTSLPSWLATPIRVSPTATATFEEVGIPADIGTALRAKGFKDAFAIQAAVCIRNF